MIKLSTVLNEHEMAVLANVEKEMFWQLVKKIVDCELDTMDDEVRTTPKLCDEDLTEDLRYKIGGIDRLKWVLELPSEARGILEQR